MCHYGDQDAVLVRIVVSIHGCLDSALVKNDYRGLSGLILAFECANTIGENFDLAAGSKESHHPLCRSRRSKNHLLQFFRLGIAILVGLIHVFRALEGWLVTRRPRIQAAE